MNFINIGMEEEATDASEQKVDLDPSETEQAVQAVQNQESTEPAKVLQVANYKQELAILQQQKANAAPEDGGEGGEGTEGGDDTTTDDTSTDASGTEPSEGEDPPTEENVSEDDSSSEAEPVNTDSELGEEAPDKPAEEVAQEQYIVEGQQKVYAALESVFVMGKYHDFLSKREQLGGIDKHAARVVTNAFEHHALACGYKIATPTPALESYSNYTGAILGTTELKVAIEGFLDTVWEAIKKFFKSIWTWIMDLLSPKKSTNASPADKRARDKAIVELEQQNQKLAKQLEAVEKLREKDNDRKGEIEAEKLRRESREASVKINKKIASMLFKTSDKGSFTEISQNVRMMSEVTAAAVKYATALAKVMQLAGVKSLNGELVEIVDLSVNKNAIGGISFNEQNRDSKSAVFEAITDEILGGVGARFVFAGTDATAIAKTVGTPRVIQELGHQGFKMVSVHDKSGFPTQLPDLNKAELANLRQIVVEVDASYKGLSVIQETVVKLSDIIKKNSESAQPASWNNLSKQTIAQLQMQLNFVGLMETSLVVGYKSLSDQANNFKNAYIQLTNYFIAD